MLQLQPTSAIPTNTAGCQAAREGIGFSCCIVRGSGKNWTSGSTSIGTMPCSYMLGILQNTMKTGFCGYKV